MLSSRQFSELYKMIDNVQQKNELKLESCRNTLTQVVGKKFKIHLILSAHKANLGRTNRLVKLSQNTVYKLLREIKPEVLGIEGSYASQHTLRKYVKIQYSIWENLGQPDISFDALYEYYERYLKHYANLRYSVQYGRVTSVGVEDREIYILTEIIRSVLLLNIPQTHRTRLTKIIFELHDLRSDIMLSKIIQTSTHNELKRIALPVGLLHCNRLSKTLSNFEINHQVHLAVPSLAI